MELDELKDFWTKVQVPKMEAQKLTSESLNILIMQTTNSFLKIQKSTKRWNNLSKAICTCLIASMVIYGGASWLVPREGLPFVSLLPFIAIMIVYALVTMYAHSWLERIFNRDINKNVRESLTSVLVNFKQFYILSTLTYLVLYPAYFYAFIKLFFSDWQLSQNSVYLICGGLTIAFLVFGHIYYRMKYFKDLEIIRRAVEELED